MNNVQETYNTKQFMIWYTLNREIDINTIRSLKTLILTIKYKKVLRMRTYAKLLLSTPKLCIVDRPLYIHIYAQIIAMLYLLGTILLSFQGNPLIYNQNEFTHA